MVHTLTIAAIRVENKIVRLDTVAILKNAISAHLVIRVVDHAVVHSQGTVGTNHLTIVPQGGICILTQAKA